MNELLQAYWDWLNQPVVQHMGFGFLAALPLIGSMLGGLAGGRSKGKQEEANLLMQRDALQNQQYGTAQNAQFQAGQQDLQRKGFTEDARGNRARQAMIGDLLQNLQDVNISVPGVRNATVTGGLRPSALGDQGRQAAGNLAKQALMAQMTPDQFSGGALLTPPKLSALPQSNWFDKFLNIAAPAASIAGGLFGQQGQTQAPQVGQVQGLDPSITASLYQDLFGKG